MHDRCNENFIAQGSNKYHTNICMIQILYKYQTNINQSIEHKDQTNIIREEEGTSDENGEVSESERTTRRS